MQSGAAFLLCGFLVSLFLCLNPSLESTGLGGSGDLSCNEECNEEWSWKTPLTSLSPSTPHTFSIQSPFLAWTLRTSLLLKVEESVLWPKGGQKEAQRTCLLIPDAPSPLQGEKQTIYRSPCPWLQLTHCSVSDPGFSSTFEELQGPGLEGLQHTTSEKQRVVVAPGMEMRHKTGFLTEYSSGGLGAGGAKGELPERCGFLCL